jgi:hypothetical protein
MAYGGAGTGTRGLAGNAGPGGPGLNNPGMIYLSSLSVMPYAGVTLPYNTYAENYNYYANNTSLLWQVNEYYKISPTISHNTLITIEAGANDALWNNISGIDGKQSADNIGQAIQNLINMGGSSFIVPFYNMSTSTSTEWLKDWTQDYEDELSLVLQNLKDVNPTVHIYDINVESIMGYERLEKDGLLWSVDNFHPSTVAHEQLANYVDSQVPIPAAAWLLGSGLIGLVGLRRKFKK